MNDHMTTRQKQIPNRIDILVSMRGDMSIDSQGTPLNGGKGDIHVEYVRADSIEVMTDEELVKRLRERGGLWPVTAADRIEALTAERDKAYAIGYSDAETEISKSALGQRVAFLNAEYANAAARIKQLTAESDRLREALDEISVAKPGYDPARVLRECVQIALFALKGQSHE